MKNKPLSRLVAMACLAIPLLAGCHPAENSSQASSEEGTSASPDVSTTSVAPVTSYVVEFHNYDDTLLSTISVEEGKAATYDKTTPVRSATAEYTYTFEKWDKEDLLKAVHQPVSTKAVYTAEANQYSYSFISRGVTLSSGNARYGTAISTVKPADSKVADYEDEDHAYTHHFEGWDITNDGNVDELPENLFANLAAVAVYSDRKQVAYTFKNSDGTILQETKYTLVGGNASYTGATPTKVGDATYDYYFAEWDKPLGNLQIDTIFTATYTRDKKSFAITFKGYSTTTKESGVVASVSVNVKYGTTLDQVVPTYSAYYDGALSASSDFIRHQIKGWLVDGVLTTDLSTVSVSKAMTVEAQYDDINYYGLILCAYDGTVLDTVYCPNGTTFSDALALSSKKAELESREATAQYTYTFKGYSGGQDTADDGSRAVYDLSDPASAINGFTLSLFAVFNRTLNVYSITFYDASGAEMTAYTQSAVAYGDSYAVPSISDRPAKAEDTTNHIAYLFTGWSTNGNDNVRDTLPSTVNGTLVCYPCYDAVAEHLVTFHTTEETGSGSISGYPKWIAEGVWVDSAPSDPGAHSDNAQYDFTFTGWSMASVASEDLANLEASSKREKYISTTGGYVAPSADTDYYPVYSYKTNFYAVYFKNDNGTTNLKSTNLEYGTSLAPFDFYQTIATSTPASTHTVTSGHEYRFVGWSNGGTTYTSGMALTLTGVTTFTAVYSDVTYVKLTLQVNNTSTELIYKNGNTNGSESWTGVKAYSDQTYAMALSNYYATKDGDATSSSYTFAGWTNSSGVSQTSLATTAVTFTPIFNANAYHLGGFAKSGGSYKSSLVVSSASDFSWVMGSASPLIEGKTMSTTDYAFCYQTKTAIVDMSLYEKYSNYAHGLYLRGDGTVYVEGYDHLHCLGLGSGSANYDYTYNEKVSYQVCSSLSGKTITAIATGSSESLAIDSAGNLYVCGGVTGIAGWKGFSNRGSGFTGGKIFTDPVNSDSFLILLPNGNVYAYGYPISGQSSKWENETNQFATKVLLSASDVYTLETGSTGGSDPIVDIAFYNGAVYAMTQGKYLLRWGEDTIREGISTGSGWGLVPSSAEVMAWPTDFYGHTLVAMAMDGDSLLIQLSDSYQLVYGKNTNNKLGASTSVTSYSTPTLIRSQGAVYYSTVNDVQAYGGSGSACYLFATTDGVIATGALASSGNPVYLRNAFAI